jgi:4-amino-4-deoxy-L-arabinose transferase-like glycosyltransferase
MAPKPLLSLDLMRNKIIIITIFLLGAILRLWQLDQLPPSLTWDEAAIGYNAYSILKTGKDEHGVFMPIIFKSFGDYKPGLYVYLTVPVVAVFGLNEFAVRLPSVMFGILGILSIYLLANKLFPQTCLKFKRFTINLGEIAAFALAVNPWHLHFSRGAWEVNVFITLLSLSIYFLISSLTQTKLLAISLVLAALTLFTYQAAKMLTPAVIFLIIIFYHQKIIANIKPWLTNKINLISLILFLIFTSWIFLGMFFSSAGNRLATQNVFNYRPKPSAFIIKIDENNSNSIFLFHNQIELSSRMVFSRFINNISADLLFYQGKIVSERGHIPNMGMFYLFDAFWILLGICYLTRIKTDSHKQFLIGLLFLAVIPGSLTLAELSTVRNLFFVIPANILIALGMFKLLSIKRLFLIIFIPIYLINIIYGLDLYFFHSRAGMAPEFNYGYKQAIDYIKRTPSQKVVMTDVYGQPYIYYLFYTQYNPSKYQQLNAYIDQGLDVGRVDKIDNIEFHQFSIDDIKTQKDTIFIGTQGNITNEFNYELPQIDDYTHINYPDNTPMFRIVKTKP